MVPSEHTDTKFAGMCTAQAFNWYAKYHNTKANDKYGRTLKIHRTTTITITG